MDAFSVWEAGCSALFRLLDVYKRQGFYTDGLLITADGICLPLTPKEELRIAHPTDLYASGNWHAYQKFLFEDVYKRQE